MRNTIFLICLISSVSSFGLTKKEILTQSVKTYLALKKGQDKMYLLNFDDLGIVTKNGKTILKLELNLKQEIANEFYFRRLRLNLQLKASKQFSPIPYVITGVGAVLVYEIVKNLFSK